MAPEESDTLRLLADMTDAGQFERLATAVLRIGDPIYRSIGHTGVNADGKTVKAPVDNIGFVRGAAPLHAIAAHHTISARAGLEAKWLHDPANVVPRNPKGIPTAPAGDLLKTAKFIDDLKEQVPGLQATLALTTNREPEPEVTKKAVAEGSRLGFTVDIWSAARIAAILDDDPDGQWVRFKFFGVSPRRVSLELLKSLSKKELDRHITADDQDLRVPRSLDEVLASAVEAGPMTFLVAPSGTGKTVSCHELLRRHIQLGGHGFIVDPSTIETAQSIESAYEAVLQRAQPALAQGCGATALALARPQARLLLVIEDVNRSRRPDLVLERLVSWAPKLAGEEGEVSGSVSWRVLCPTWMRSIDQLSDTARGRIMGAVLLGGAFRPNEGAAAVAKRADAMGAKLLPLDVERVSGALGHDPLLIGLYGFETEASPELAISDWLGASTRRLASGNGDFTASDYQSALDLLGRFMLRHRHFSPSWPDVAGWFAGAGDETLTMLRRLVRQEEILSLTPQGETEELVFRHDRVRDEILVRAASRMMLTAEMGEDLWFDPFLAELLGRALAREIVPEDAAAKLKDTNPLALFHAFAALAPKKSARRDGVVKAIQQWLSRPEAQGRGSFHCRWVALGVLSDVEAAEVPAMVDGLQIDCDEALQAAFLNGRVDAGYWLCGRTPPGVIDPWRDRIVAHAAERFGTLLISAVTETLRDPDTNESGLAGALRLAGFLGEEALAEPIRAAWQRDRARSVDLSDHLWAALRCSHGRADDLLEILCDAWATLPDSRSETNPISKRDMISEHSLPHAVGRVGLPASTLTYLSRRAVEDPVLRRPISSLLRFVDDPQAVAARVLADARSALEGGYEIRSSAVVSSSVFRFSERFGAATRERLKEIWTDRSAEMNSRHAAFNIWEAGRGPDDQAVLRAIERDDALAEPAVGARLRRGDHDACSDLLEKLQGPNPAFWWQLGYQYWSAELTAALDNELRRSFAGAAAPDDDRLEFIVVQLLARLPPRDAERLVEDNWTSIGHRAAFVKLALYLGKPRFSELAGEALQRFPDKSVALSHLTFTYGVRITGHPGVTRRGQVESLLPHLGSLSKLDLMTMRDECRRHGWVPLAEQLNMALPEQERHPRPFEEKGMRELLDGCVASTGRLHLTWELDGLLKAYPEVTREWLVLQSLAWAGEQGTIEALEIAAIVVTHLGKRNDAERFGSLVAGLAPDLRPEAREIAADTEFFVRLYSLI